MKRVLVVEDLPTARRLLVEVLRADPELEVVGEAVDGLEAVELTKRLRPDVITMDVLMPRLDGLDATARIMADAPTPIVIVSSLDVGEVRFALDALRAGALVALPKPRGPGSPGFEADARRLVTTVKSMATVAVLPRASATVRPRLEPPAPSGRRPARVLAMAASAGGPAAVQTVLEDLPSDLATPVLLVQHIAQGFGGAFAAWLGSTTGRDVVVAPVGEALRPGRVYVAPDGSHLGVAGGAVALSSAPPIEGFRPSATYLFRSVAEAFGGAAVAVILSGMGRDGVDGLRALHDAGAFVVAQDEGSSAVFGMPAAAIAAGVVDEVVALDRVALTIRPHLGA